MLPSNVTSSVDTRTGSFRPQTDQLSATTTATSWQRTTTKTATRKRKVHVSLLARNHAIGNLWRKQLWSRDNFHDPTRLDPTNHHHRYHHHHHHHHRWTTAGRSGPAVALSGCSARGPGIESRCGQLCLSHNHCDLQPWAP